MTDENKTLENMIIGGFPLNEIAGKNKIEISRLRREIKSLGLQDNWKEANEEYKRKIFLKKYSHVQELIDNGKTLAEIGEYYGVVRERARQIIEKLGLLKKRKIIRKKVKQDIQDKNYSLHQSIISILYQKALQLAEQESSGARKAIEYLIHSKRKNIIYLPPKKKYKTIYSYTELKTIFDRYQEAKQKGIKLSLEELANGLYIFPSGISVILKKSGLEPMYGARERSSNISKEKIDAIQRGAYKTDLSYNDIGYFLDIPNYIGQNNRPKNRGSKKPIKMWINRTGIGAYLSYSLASQIYESQDLGFNQEETTFLLNTKDFVVSYALEHRSKIEPKLIKQLRILYSNKEQNKPYKTEEVKPALKAPPL